MELKSPEVIDFARAKKLRYFQTENINREPDMICELKALELLGKISEVGLFTTQTEVTVTHKTSDELADAIRERITRLLNPEEEKEILVDPEDELDIQDVEEVEQEEEEEEEVEQEEETPPA